MKGRKLFALAILAALAAFTPKASQGIGPSCAFFCAQVRCIPEDVCGLYVNGAGQTVCGCHPRP